MGLQSSLFAGVAGLNANGETISIIGDNIANTNTIGFKSSRPEFVDVLSGSLGGVGGAGDIGAGARLNGVNQNFTQGSLESTGVTTDVAIDGGGFFIVQDTTGVFYTRNGQFRLDSNQILVNAQGQTVQGFGITPAGVPNGALGNIDLSTVASVPVATDTVEVNVNLDPNDTAPPGGAAGFDHTDPVTTSNFQTGIRIFDSLGNPRNLLIYFRKDDAANNSWFWYAGVNRGEMDFSTYGAPFNGFTTPAVSANDFFPVQSGTLTFTATGALNIEGNAALAVPYDSDGDGTVDVAATATPGNAGGWSFAGGAAAGQLLAFDLGTTPSEGGTGTDRTTQFGGSAASGVNSFVRFMNQNGFSAGSLSSVDIDEDGFVTGSFSNGQTSPLAQIALANFPNVNGVKRIGKNNFIETNESGNRVVGSPNQGVFGGVRSGFLEQSNTDLAEEFVRLILSQRAFQANTRTISTTNELLANLVVLGQ
jgi:flagellar hook protein FlgE